MENKDSYSGPKTVRMFYCLVVKHVIPHTPPVGRAGTIRSALSDKKWEVEYCESLTLQLMELLEPQNFQIAFDEKAGLRPSKEKQLTYLVPFLVSKVHDFKAEEISIPKPGYAGFTVKSSALSLVRETLAKDIRDTLGTKVAIHELAFSMATSRHFVFEIYYEGSFIVKREFSDDDIESAGGVRDALESFFNEIESVIEQFGFKLMSTPSGYQRSRNNEYLFGISYTPHIGFSERDVHGEGCYAIRGDASTDEVNEYGVDFENTLEDETKVLLESALEENLPPHAELISHEISYVDDSEEVFDVCDELICFQNMAFGDSDAETTRK